jgi:hypothetical protein
LASAAQGADAVALAGTIDGQIDARLESEKLQRVPQADDAEFLRRVSLDLHGVVPSAEQAAKFLDSRDPGKRAKLIEELLASPRFGQHFGNIWRGRLISPLVNEQRLQTERFTEWLAERFNQNDGWDRIVFDLLTASGKLDENAAVTYLIEGRNPLAVTDLTDLTSHYFLGIRLNCAQCHDHPFAEWKRQDYWGMAAFFASIQTPGRPKMVYLAGVQDNPRLTLATLSGGDMLEGYLDRSPTFLGGSALDTTTSQTTREALASWMTSPENPYFARAAVNRMWWHFFGRGIVNPVDDMHSGNPPSHPELLEILSQQFVESDFDLKFLCRSILNSRTYHQTSRPGKSAEAEGKWFARMSIKVLSAEQLYDSLVAILGPPAKASGIDVRLGTRYEFTQYFASDGDPDPTRYDRGIPHVLRLMNSPQFAGRSVDALAFRLATNDRPADEVVEELFLTILARRPRAGELDLAREHLRLANLSRQTAYRELAWTLLMGGEFSLNH